MYGEGKKMEYRNAYCPGAFQFIIKSVDESSIDNLLFSYMRLHLCRHKLHSYIFHVKSIVFKVEPLNKLEKPGTEKAKIHKHNNTN